MGEGRGKVVSLGDVRAERGMRPAHVETVLKCGPFTGHLNADGSLDLVIDGALVGNGMPCKVTVSIDEGNTLTLARGLLHASIAQKNRVKKLRSAHLWIVRPHPTSPTLRLVRHDDTERVFRRSIVGARASSRFKPAGHAFIDGERRRFPCADAIERGVDVRLHWHCSSCFACILQGAEMWVEKKDPEKGWAWQSAKLCATCVQPREEGMRVVGGEGDEPPLSTDP